MPRSRRTEPKRDEGADIVERHLCRDGVEVALVSVPVGMFSVVLIHPGPDGKPVRRPIGGQWFDRERMARRMMDMQAAVCAMQHAGFALPWTSIPDDGKPALASSRKNKTAVPAAPVAAASDASALSTEALEAELRTRNDHSGRFLHEGETTLKDADEPEFAGEAAVRKLRIVDERDVLLEDFDEMRSLAVRRDWRGLLRAIEAQLPHELQGLERGLFGAEFAPGHTDLMVPPEAIDAYLVADPPPDSLALDADLFG